MPEFVNVAAHLPRLAREQPDALALACPAGRDRSDRPIWVHLTSSQLDRESDRAARALAGVGISRGTRTALLVRPSPEFFALTFALFKLNAVPVLIDPGIGARNMGRCLDEAEPEAFVGIPAAQAARWMLGWARRTVRKVVTVGRPALWGFGLQSLLDDLPDGEPFVMVEPEPDDAAAILFTSGSTGAPKGAVYTHGNFSAQVRLLREIYGIEPGERDLSTFPLFALFGPALGMAAIVPEMDATRPGKADPRKLLEAFHAWAPTNMFGSPALLENLSRYGAAEGITIPSLRRVISAGAPVPAAVLERMRRILPADARIYTPYGATESLPVASIESREILEETRLATERGEGVCVGRPVTEMEVRVIRITDEAIDTWSDDLGVATGEIGEIVVHGPVVTRHYYGRDEATRLAKIDNGDGSVRHRMGDLGYFDESGRLWFCGRKAHRVQMAGETLFTVPCEAIFNQHPEVRRTALVGVRQNGSTLPVLCIELEPSSPKANAATIQKELLEIGARHEITRGIRTILLHPSFPVDIRHNAKIFREKLARWAEARLR